MIETIVKFQTNKKRRQIFLTKWVILLHQSLLRYKVLNVGKLILKIKKDRFSLFEQNVSKWSVKGIVISLPSNICWKHTHKYLRKIADRDKSIWLNEFSYSINICQDTQC